MLVFFLPTESLVLFYRYLICTAAIPLSFTVNKLMLESVHEVRHGPILNVNFTFSGWVYHLELSGLQYLGFPPESKCQLQIHLCRHCQLLSPEQPG